MNETKNYSITKSGAVILEGGANRGVFTAGALDFLMEQEYYIPHVIGVSAGACNALDYVSRQIGRTRDCMIVTDEKNLIRIPFEQHIHVEQCFFLNDCLDILIDVAVFLIRDKL